MALKPRSESELFLLLVFELYLTLLLWATMGLLWGEELVGCLYCCPATCPVTYPQTREHSSFIVSMTLSVVFAVLS